MNPEPVEPVHAPPDVEIGRYALRSFACFSRPSGYNRAFPYWSDNTVKGWESITHPKEGDWADGTCEAQCGRDHQAPDEKCSCGIYGSLSYADLIAQFRQYTNRFVGVFAAEGITIIGSRGLRTQFARIVAYWADPAPTPGGLWVGPSRRGAFRATATAYPIGPSYREIAAHQFTDARVFDCPFEMVEAYGLPLLPPAAASPQGRALPGGSAWWTKAGE